MSARLSPSRQPVAEPAPEPVSRVGGAAGSSEVPAVRSPVSPGFFDTLGLRVLTGRDFDWRDHSRSRRVAVISRGLADRLFGGGAAVGQRIRMGVAPENQDVEVVGIVADARLYNLKESNVAAAYVPALQTPDPAGKCYVVGGRGVSIAAVRQAVESLGVELINSPVESLRLHRRPRAAAGAVGGRLRRVLRDARVADGRHRSVRAHFLSRERAPP